MITNLKDYAIQLLNLKEVVLEDNPELKEELQMITKILKQYESETKQYERLYTKEELREQIGSIRSIDYLIQQQQGKLFNLTNAESKSSFYKTNITIIGLNIKRLKQYRQELKTKMAEDKIFFTKQKNITNSWKYKQC